MKSTQLWLPVWWVFAAFFENMAQQPLISVFSVSLGASTAVAGLTVSIYSLTNIGGNLASHWLLNRLGARFILGWGMLAVGLTVTAAGLSQAPLQLILLRSLHGLLGGLVVPVIFVYLATLSRRQHYGSTMARGGIAIAIASTIGPVFAGFLNQLGGFTVAFAGVGGILIISGLGALFFVPRQTIQHWKSVPWRRILDMWRAVEVKNACRIAFAFMAALGIMAFRFPLRGQELGFSSGQIGLGFGIFSLTAAIIMWPAGRLSDRRGRKPLLIGGLILSAGGMLSLSWGHAYATLLAAMVAHGAGFGILFPVTNALLLDGSQMEERGAAFGVFHGFFSLGVFSGPLLAVALLNYTSPFHVAAAILFSAAALTGYGLPDHDVSSPTDSAVVLQEKEGE